MNIEQLKANFENDGYIWIKNFFNDQEKNLFLKAFENAEYIEEINSSPEITSIKELSFIFENKKLIEILNHLSDYKLTYFGVGSLIGHRPQNKISWRRMHTDTRGNENNPNGKTYYDPSKKTWPIIDIFIYLEDFENYSGCLKVVKGSHKKFLPTIGNFIKVFFNISKSWKFDGKYSLKSIPFDYLFKMENIKTKPGDLFIFNHALHHSPNSLLLKKFENLVLPVFLENFLQKLIPKIFKKFSHKRRMISICFGKKSKELDYFLRSRVQYLNKDYFSKSRFFHDEEFRNELKKKKMESNISLKDLIINKEI